jgi:hypothetical protein
MKNETNSASQTKPIGLKNNILVQELERELLVYDLTRDKVFCLNETSSIVWNSCDGNNSVEDIRQNLSVQLKTEISEEMIWLTLDKLKSEQLLSNYEEFDINFNGLSRRQVIKKVGLSTMVALPLISAIVSPTAVAAQSGALVCPNANCICPDLTCSMFGPVALLQNACDSTACSGTGGSSCRCVGPFFCFGLEERFGMCAVI